jgi:hypothetical protein
MNQIKLDPLVATVEGLQVAVDAACHGRDSQWADSVHFALGQLAAAIQQQVQAAEKSMEIVGDINPDFQNAPVTERHIEGTREQLIKLGEQVHQLRADIRNARESSVVDAAQIRWRGNEICAAVDKVRHADNEFLQTTFNTDLGAGE